MQDAIQHTPSGDIIPCDPALVSAEQKLTSIGREFILRERIASIVDEYDYIIIDTPPAMGVLLSNALIAANKVIVPITADRYSLQGLSDFNSTIATIQKFTNPQLKIDGLLLSKYNGRTVLTKEISFVLPKIADMLQTQVYDAKIRESTATREAQVQRTNVINYAPKSTTAQDFMEFVEEFLRKEAE